MCVEIRTALALNFVNFSSNANLINFNFWSSGFRLKFVSLELQWDLSTKVSLKFRGQNLIGLARVKNF